MTPKTTKVSAKRNSSNKFHFGQWPLHLLLNGIFSRHKRRLYEHLTPNDIWGVCTSRQNVRISGEIQRGGISGEEIVLLHTFLNQSEIRNLFYARRKYGRFGFRFGLLYEGSPRDSSIMRSLEKRRLDVCVFSFLQKGNSYFTWSIFGIKQIVNKHPSKKEKRCAALQNFPGQ